MANDPTPESVDTVVIGGGRAGPATGTLHHPRIPDFADALHGDVLQLHSSDCRRG